MQTAAQPFTVGDEVAWTSSNLPKIGHVTHVVPAGKRPADVGVNIREPGLPRDHETYVVRGCTPARNGTMTGPFRNYWPRVSLLQKHAIPA